MSSNTIGPCPQKSDVSGEKIKKSSGPLPMKSDAPSEKVKKSGGGLDDIKNLLVTTIDTVDKGGTTDTVDPKKGK